MRQPTSVSDERSAEQYRRVLTLLVQVVPPLALMLMGWGFSDAQGFFLDPARAGLIGLVLIACLCILLRDIDASPTRRGSHTEGGQLPMLLMCVVLAAFLSWFMPFADRRSYLTLRDSEDIRAVGLLACTAAVMVRLAAMSQLGTHFSAFVTLQPDHRLVTSGIYSRLRHPLYLSLLLVSFGLPLTFRSWLALPAFIFTAAFVRSRIRAEEELLEATFQREYVAYRCATWSLLPFVY